MDEINQHVVNAIEENRYALCEDSVKRQYELQPEIWTPYGEPGLKKSIRDADHHFSYLIQAVRQNDPSILGAYVMWLRELFQGLKFPPEVLPVMLECVQQAVQNLLPPEISTKTGEYIDAALAALERESAHQMSFITEQSPLYGLSKQYLEALLKGDRRHASRLILDAVEGGELVKEVYLHVFQASQYEVGRLWYTNKITVAQEHFCSAATQLIMSQLYPYIFAREKTGGKFVAASVGGDLHEIGIRMVADFFEMDGWDTYYIGANTPASSIVSTVEDYQPDILGISSTMPFHVTALRDLISEIRASEPCKKLKIMVGGYWLKASPDLWRTVGADGFADDAQQAIALASKWSQKKA